MFRALLSDLQEVLHKRHFFTMRAVCAAPPEDEKVMLEICRGP
jgi:hypothetical protein